MVSLKRQQRYSAFQNHENGIDQRKLFRPAFAKPCNGISIIMNGFKGSHPALIEESAWDWATTKEFY